MVGDMAQTVIHVTNQSFKIGIELSAPFLIMGLLLYATMGILQRLMPNVQLFLIMMPVEIWGGLTILSLTVAGILTFWLRYFDQALGTFFQV
jgi:flagellar biosynthetic protein FliR